MKAYKNFIKLTEAPDVADVRNEGRRSAIGRLRRGEKSYRFKNNIVQYADGTPGRDLGRICHNDRGYNRPRSQGRCPSLPQARLSRCRCPLRGERRVNKSEVFS